MAEIGFLGEEKNRKFEEWRAQRKSAQQEAFVSPRRLD